ncbi:MAG: hypothetical protein LUQ65_08175 [Candidatus Helarchaeota archaeon]|nr:hypothetical protein [Candidatus Helarchaeota archaeon]
MKKKIAKRNEKIAKRSEKIAKRSDWALQEMPKENISINLFKQFSKQEMQKVKKGKIPESQDDNWFIFYEDAQLYFHRSSTGFCIYIVKFEEKDDGYITTEVIINRNKKQFTSTNAAIDVDVVMLLLDGIKYGQYE